MSELSKIMKIYRFEFQTIKLADIGIEADPHLNPIIATEFYLTRGELDKAQMVIDTKFIPSNFIHSVVLMRCQQKLGNLMQVIHLQIYWQKIMDKLEKNDYICFYFGVYFYTLGMTYTSYEEFEISSQLLKKGEPYFSNLKFEPGCAEIHKMISSNYENLGAWGDARYHLRQQLKFESRTTVQVQILKQLIQNAIEDQRNDLADRYRMKLKKLIENS